VYVPRQFREERPDVLARAMRDIQFAALVTGGPEGLHASHVPMVRIPMKPPGYTDLKPPAVPISKRPPFQSQTARDGVVS